MRIGVLTGGGDCPGLNPAIRGIVMRALDHNYDIVGLRQGWAGLREAETTPLTLEVVEHIISQGGTILESSRTNPLKDEGSINRCLDNARKLGLDALIALGGEDTLGAAHGLCARGLNCVGVPKTMDNDLNATDYTFGFNSAITVAVDAADNVLSHENRAEDNMSAADLIRLAPALDDLRRLGALDLKINHPRAK